MSLIKWEPLREFEDVFDRYAKAMGWPNTRSQELVKVSDWMPKVDISETEQAFGIHVEIPNVSKDAVKVNVDNGVLSIAGERKQNLEENSKKFHRIERSYGSFYRSFTLPDNVDEAGIKATFKDGMLDLTIPRTAVQKPKSIAIAVE